MNNTTQKYRFTILLREYIELGVFLGRKYLFNFCILINIFNRLLTLLKG